MNNNRRFNYGGQAIIEGVMIRGQRKVAIAVRRPDGGLALRAESLPRISTGSLRQIPFVRGIIVLAESLILGTRALLFSSNVAMAEEGKEITSGAMWAMLGGALLLVVGLFFLVPVFLAGLLERSFDSPFLTHLVEGAIRLAFFVAYIVGIGLIPDIKRVFSYHGAEHKAVNAHEAGAPMAVEEIRKFPTAHMRCGTSFLLIVLVLAILVFGILGQPPIAVRILSRIILIPVIAAIAYEIIRFGGAHSNNGLVRALLSPGLALQALTTREPDDRQIEVALSALQEAIRLDGVEPKEEQACTTS
ncbi:MAG: DUF1385 domain-containing protein [Chloroflexi bacterium]|nr:DUF1385 domain-containing protein [Chloroflexota bacterium]